MYPNFVNAIESQICRDRNGVAVDHKGNRINGSEHTSDSDTIMDRTLHDTSDRTLYQGGTIIPSAMDK